MPAEKIGAKEQKRRQETALNSDLKIRKSKNFKLKEAICIDFGSQAECQTPLDKLRINFDDLSLELQATDNLKGEVVQKQHRICGFDVGTQNSSQLLEYQAGEEDGFKTPVTQRSNDVNIGNFSRALASGDNFTVRKPLRSRKHLLLIRHGESEFNAAIQESKFFNDPAIFDPYLTEKGQKQSSALKDQLRELQHKGDFLVLESLVIVSPLVRCLETYLLSHPRMRKGALREGARLAVQGAGRVDVIISPLATERCRTPGDVGRPVSDLKKLFPQLERPLADVSDRWWYNPQQNDAQLGKCMAEESKAEFLGRVEDFKSLLSAIPEQFIMLYSHSHFIRALANLEEVPANCQVAKLSLGTTLSRIVGRVKLVTKGQRETIEL